MIVPSPTQVSPIPQTSPAKPRSAVGAATGLFLLSFDMDGQFDDLIISVLAGMAVAGFVIGTYLIQYAPH